MALGTSNRDRRRQATRREIVEAAWDLARANGLAGISLRDVAAAVGMQAPSLYSYFPSKHAIYDAMFAQGAQEFRDHYGLLDITGDARRDVAAGLASFVEFCMQNTSRYQLLFQRPIPGFEPSPESYAVAVAGYEDMAAHLAAMGVTDPESLDLLTALGAGLAAQQMANDPGGDRWLRLVDRAAAMFLTQHQHPPLEK